MLPTSASTRRSWTSSPKRRLTYEPSTSSAVEVRGRNGSQAARSLPRHDSSPVVTNGPSAAGTPSTIAPGMSCSPSCHTAARRVRRRRELAESGPLGQLDGFGGAGEERVGSLVDRQPRERRRSDLAAQPRVGLAHGDVDAAGDQRLRGGQPGDPAADHQHAPATARGHQLLASSCARAARASITRGSSLTQAVRSNTRPRDSARWRASMSRS